MLLDDESAVFDIVGVGFGPANLSLSIAITEFQKFNFSTLFFEEKLAFSWHPEMILDDAEMQISFLKDMVTLRNPSSEFTFLNYLH